MVAATARALFAKFGAWDAEALLEPQEPLSGTKPGAGEFHRFTKKIEEFSPKAWNTCTQVNSRLISVSLIMLFLLLPRRHFFTAAGGVAAVVGGVGLNLVVAVVMMTRRNGRSSQMHLENWGSAFARAMLWRVSYFIALWGAVRIFYMCIFNVFFRGRLGVAVLIIKERVT